MSLQQLQYKTSVSAGGPQFSLDYWVCALPFVNLYKKVVLNYHYVMW